MFLKCTNGDLVKASVHNLGYACPVGTRKNYLIFTNTPKLKLLDLKTKPDYEFMDHSRSVVISEHDSWEDLVKAWNALAVQLNQEEHIERNPSLEIKQ